MSEAALKQITDKKYDTEMRNAGIQTIYKYGVAFSGKNVEIAVEQEMELTTANNKNQKNDPRKGAR